MQACLAFGNTGPAGTSFMIAKTVDGGCRSTTGTDSFGDHAPPGGPERPGGTAGQPWSHGRRL